MNWPLCLDRTQCFIPESLVSAGHRAACGTTPKVLTQVESSLCSQERGLAGPWGFRLSDPCP